MVMPCPTVDTAFEDEDERARMRALCIRYDPIDHDPAKALGVGGLGALIAFAHGVPNNAPRILYKTGRGWTPLFPARVTAGLRTRFVERLSTEAISIRLRQMRQARLASGPWLREVSADARCLLLVMAALTRGPRADEALARRTGLTILDVQRWVREATRLNWIGAARRLTDRGQRELAHARRAAPGNALEEKELPFVPKEPYYPKSLRAPRAQSS